MRNKLFAIVLLYCFFLLTGRVYGIGEKILSFGSTSSWEVIENLRGVTEAPLIRPQPVLVLAGGDPRSFSPADLRSRSIRIPEENCIDLSLSFDEGKPGRFADSQGRYDVTVSPELAVAADPWSRIGAGAALFSRGASLTLKPRLNTREGANALFTPGNHIRDFSVEFWLYPQSLETGALIFSLNASKSNGRHSYINQLVQCEIARNRIHWTFGDFFFSPGEKDTKSLSLSGPVALPRAWSHHLIRFDADLGLLEYLVDGRVEALDYVTSTGREGGDVYTPVIGEDCRLVLGSRFSGMVDEFRVHRNYLEKAALAKYHPQGGRVETRTLDLGNNNSRVLKIEAFGGRTSNTAGRVRNEYAGNGNLRFQDHSGLNFFIRIGNSPYRWNDVPWTPVKPGTELPDTRGRYVQIAVDFYPSGDGETSPYLAELRVIYNAADPPPPPVQVIAKARDGAVELSWKASSSREVGGYLVYYGTARGEYFGKYAILGNVVHASPIDVGNRVSIRIEGLRNGTLYYFAVAAYNEPLDGAELYFEPDPGEFSREVAARPLLRPAEDV